MVYEQKGARGRGLAAVSAAVLFCACRQEGLPRTFKVQLHQTSLVLLQRDMSVVFE